MLNQESVYTCSICIHELVSKGCKLVGCGSAVPHLQISNDDLARIVDTSDEWISARTGIRNRRILSVWLHKKHLKWQMSNLDLILLCTSTPEDLFGGAPQIEPDDACDSEEDSLFGFDLHSDGDGNRHLHAGINKKETNHELGTNGSALGFPPNHSSFSCIKMNGTEVFSRGGLTLREGVASATVWRSGGNFLDPPLVFRFAVSVVPQTIEASLAKAGLDRSDIDWLLLHQANQRIIDGVATRLEVPKDRVITNLANYGNTSAASIPLALDEAGKSNKVKP
ncbi:putative beta-ketoacyl-[acyl-carrier-protein] synthase III [Helianthus annuus]|nr:putative beta-ketoacyl-[acyl-carrier-protein] synthase III [Helianthus annuus]